jgi:shikimate kinase
MNAETRALIREKAISVWLKADIDILARRVARKETRPLLRGKDPAEILTQLAAVRYPVYALADLTVELGETPHHESVAAVVSGLQVWLDKDKIAP